MKRVLVIGAYGLLGTPLCVWLQAAGHDVFRQGRKESAELRGDPADPAAVADLIERCRPDVIVNLAATTNVDACEDDPQGAFLANVWVVESICQAMQGPRAAAVPHLVHISTDQLYDGEGPHAEGAARPCNVYGLTKYAGELAAAGIGATVLRVNFVGRSRCPGRTCLTDWLVSSLRDRKRIVVFGDVFFSPLHMTTLCGFIEQALRQRVPGVYNVGSREGLSKADFALALAERLGLDTSLMKVGSSSEVSLKARRPKDMRLDVSSFEATFGLKAPTLLDEIKLTAEEYGDVTAR